MVNVGSSYLHIGLISRIFPTGKFVYEGHRIKVKVTGAAKAENPFPQCETSIGR